MPATNDGYVDRYALPGVPWPRLEADVVNKEYVDRNPNLLNAILHAPAYVTNSTVFESTFLFLHTQPKTKYAIHLWAQTLGGTSAADMKCRFNASNYSFLRWQFTEKNAQPSTIHDNNSAQVNLQSGNEGRVEITGVLDNTTESVGTVVWEFAQAVADGTTLTVDTNSWFTLTRLSNVLG